jgi:CO/xanthine dehydrogenase Mo-binding subunit
MPEPVPPGAPRQTWLPHTDAADRVRGEFRFAVDRRVAGTLHAVAVRSDLAHGRITAIDPAAAFDVPGVRAVLDGAALRDDPAIDPWHGENRADQPVLAIEKVRYVGEPVALVVAETRAAAAEAARRVVVDIDPLPEVTDERAAGEPDAPRLHDDWPGNDCGQWTLRHGDAEAAMATAHHVHTATYRSPTQSHVAMEPHSATAAWLPDGTLEVWTGTQAPYTVRDRLAGIFRLPPERVRVRGDRLGGGFGSKLDLKLEGLAAVAARTAGAPVRIELRRDEAFLTSAKHAATVTMTTGVDATGLLVARIIDITWNAGAYALSSPRASRTGMIRSPGPYRIPHVLARSVARYTNTVPTGPFRGAMTGQVCWAHESALDEIAAELGIDPVELRRRNLLTDGDTFATGDVMPDMHYVELLDAVADSLEWTVEPAAPPGRARGRGVGVVLKTTRTPTESHALVSLSANGKVTVGTSSVEMGQGAGASLASLAAARLGVDPTGIAVSLPDTAWTPYDPTTSSSRTTFAMGLAVEAAADDLRRRLAEAVADWWDVPGEHLVHDGDTIRHPDDPTLALRLGEVVAKTGEVTGEGRYATPPGAGVLDPETSQGNVSVHFHQGAVGVEVEVDLATGAYRVLRAHGATYAGRLVDEHRAHKQTQGGVVFGLGQAMMEELGYDAGQPVNPNLSDYQIPSILDVPVVTSTVLTDPDPAAEPHGIGESTVPPTAPAVANAVYAATGVRIRDLPVTPEKILRGLREAGR